MSDLHEARVEAAARELFHDPLSLGDYTWEEMVVEDKSRADLWRDDARRVLAAADAVVTVDARDQLHAKCDCVPDLGPAHCHLCTGEGSPVKWEDCEAVREIADVSEPVEVVLTTADIEGLAHLLVQLSPATQKNSDATIRRLLREMNIKEVEW